MKRARERVKFPSSAPPKTIKGLTEAGNCLQSIVLREAGVTRYDRLLFSRPYNRGRLLSPFRDKLSRAADRPLYSTAFPDRCTRYTLRSLSRCIQDMESLLFSLPWWTSRKMILLYDDLEKIKIHHRDTETGRKDLRKLNGFLPVRSLPSNDVIGGASVVKSDFL